MRRVRLIYSRTVYGPTQKVSTIELSRVGYAYPLDKVALSDCLCIIELGGLGMKVFV